MKIKNKILTTTFSLITILGLSLVNTNKIENRKIDNRINIQNTTTQQPSISLGGLHSGAITANNDVFMWGSNHHGQLGDGTTTDKDIPTNITERFNLLEGEHITNLNLGEKHSAALSNKGNVFTWGDNLYGQVGNDEDGSHDGIRVPTNITGWFELTENEEITQINMGSNHSSALTNKGSVFTWGSNENGQLGNDPDGISKRENTPTNITKRFSLNGSEKVIQLSMGHYHSSALTNKGNVFTWGENNYGQLGDGTIATSKNTPTKITDMFHLFEGEEVIQLSMGYFHSSAVTNTDKVFTWGNNDRGQLGNGITAHENTPTDITEEFNLDNNEHITQLEMGYTHSSAFTNTHKVFTWGNNEFGQLGDGTEGGAANPTEMTEKFGLGNDEEITQINMGNHHSSALTNKNKVFMWGYHKNGRLGDGSYKNQLKPVNINLISTIDNIVPTQDTPSSMTINFNVNKNYQEGNVVIRDEKGTEKGKKDNVNGKDSITIDNLTSNTIYENWTIEVDGHKETIETIKAFTTLEYNSDYIEQKLPVTIKGELKSSDKEITLTYGTSTELDGVWEHDIFYQNGTHETITSNSNQYSVDKTHNLKQAVGNIESIETVYKIDGSVIKMDKYTGSAYKVLGPLSSGGLSGGLIAGIVIVSLLGVILILLLIWLLIKKLTNNKIEKTLYQKSVVKKPVKKPLVKKPLVKKPLVKKPVFKKPLVKKKPVKKPMVNKKQQELFKQQELLKKQLLKTNQQLLKELNNEKIQ